jgi:hypothetical protein
LAPISRRQPFRYGALPSAGIGEYPALLNRHRSLQTGSFRRKSCPWSSVQFAPLPVASTS